MIDKKGDSVHDFVNIVISTIVALLPHWQQSTTKQPEKTDLRENREI